MTHMNSMQFNGRHSVDGREYIHESGKCDNTKNGNRVVKILTVE